MRTKKRTKFNQLQEETVMASVAVVAVVVAEKEKVMAEKEKVMALLVVVVAGEDLLVVVVAGAGPLALSLMVPGFNMSRLTFMRWGLPRQSKWFHTSRLHFATHVACWAIWICKLFSNKLGRT